MILDKLYLFKTNINVKNSSILISKVDILLAAKNISRRDALHLEIIHHD